MSSYGSSGKGDLSLILGYRFLSGNRRELESVIERFGKDLTVNLLK